MESRGRLENIYELKSSIVAYMQSTPEPTLHGFLEEIALYTELDNLSEGESYVVLMTIHNAKGLEFDTVFLAGAEEGVFPSLRSAADSEELEEERRLAYVAMTRARKKLYITCTRRRMLFGRTTPNPLSRFVREIPEENINGRQPERPSVRLDSWEGWGDEEMPFTRPNTNRGGFGGYGSGGYSGGYGGSYTAKKAAARPASAPKASFKLGDSVSHTAFGDGVVTQVTPMGNDALIEVAFTKTGTKRLMANAAAKHMTKK